MQPESLPPHEVAIVLAERAEQLATDIATAEDLERLEDLIAERAMVVQALEALTRDAAAPVSSPATRAAIRVACERALRAGTPAVEHVAAIRDAIGKALTQLDAGTHAADSYLVRSTSGQFDAVR